jgi:histone acetyltransferase (RNA polymerase elongator complex component)
MSVRRMVIPVFVPHKGCPNDCIYCNQKSISGQTEEMTVTRMREIVEKHLGSFNGKRHVEIAFYGGSFTGIDESKRRELLETGQEYVNAGLVKEMRLSTRPDYIDDETLEALLKYDVRTIEIGVQSLDSKVLKISLRGHGIQEVVTACRLVKEYGFRLGIQTMIGLPGDTREKDIITAQKVVELSPEVVRIYPALVIRNTYLEAMFRNGEYSPLTIGEAVDICAELLEIYKNNGINVIRIGLQPTEEIQEGAEVVAGPFHPAFRQLVESRLMLRKIEGMIEKMHLNSSREIAIFAPEKDISNIAGQKRCNIKYLKEKYGFSKIKMIKSEEFKISNEKSVQESHM